MNRKPELLILKEVQKTEWQEWERSYIRNAKMLGFDLVNHLDGGEGGPGAKIGNTIWLGRKHSLETKKLMSDSGTGKKRSEEHCRNISLAKRGKPSSLKGRKLSEETKEKIRQTLLGNIPWNKGRKAGDVCFK